MRREDFAAVVHVCTKRPFGFVKLARHLHVLRSLPGEHENDRTTLRRLVRVELKLFCIACRKHGGGSCCITRNKRETMRKVRSPRLQRKGDISEVDLRMLL